MTARDTDADDAVPPATPGRTGPLVRRAVGAAGGRKPGSPPRPGPGTGFGAEGERPDGRRTDAVAPVDTSASSAHAQTRVGHEGEPEGSDEATGALHERLKALRKQRDALEQAQTEERERPAAGATAVARAGQGGDGPQEPSDDRRSRGRRTKVLSAVVGVVAVALIALPFLSHDKGATDDRSKVAAAGAITTPGPGSSLAGESGGLESASSTSEKPGGTTKSPGNTAVLPSTGTTFPSTGATTHTSPTGQATTQAESPEHVASDAPTKPLAPVVIKPVAKLHAAMSWKSARLQLGMQADGNLVLYDRQEKRVMWAAGTSGKDNMAAFQEDGNLVIYTAAGRAIWASDPSGFTHATLVIQPDGNVVIRSGGKQVWATHTHI